MSLKIIFSFFIFTFFSLTIGYSQHSVVFKSGQKKKGVVLQIQNDTLYFAETQRMQKFHLSKVSSIFFNEYIPYDGKFEDTTPERKVKSGNYSILYKMKGRKMITPPVISNGTQQRGRVIVDITINRNGNVIKSKAGAIGSTTSSEYLYTKAKFAAQGAKFDKSATGPLETEGTITIDY